MGKPKHTSLVSQQCSTSCEIAVSTTYPQNDDIEHVGEHLLEVQPQSTGTTGTSAKLETAIVDDQCDGLVEQLKSTIPMTNDDDDGDWADICADAMALALPTESPDAATGNGGKTLSNVGICSGEEAVVAQEAPSS